MLHRLSSPAQAGDPVTTSLSNKTATAVFTGCPACAGHDELEFRSGRSPHALGGGRLDLVGHPRLARAPPRIFVLAEIFLRQRVDVIVGAALGDALHPAAHLDV